MRLLVEKKSHPQRRYYPDGTDLMRWYPLLHIVAHGFRITLGVRHRIGFMKLLLQNEADLNGKDWLGQTVLESFTGVEQCCRVMLGSGCWAQNYHWR